MAWRVRIACGLQVLHDWSMDLLTLPFDTEFTFYVSCRNKAGLRAERPFRMRFAPQPPCDHYKLGLESTGLSGSWAQVSTRQHTPHNTPCCRPLQHPLLTPLARG